MPVYIALLRGINVGPNKRIKMDALRQTFVKLGFERIKTYIQSGNVVFKSRKSSPSALSEKLEGQIVKDFGFSASVIVRSADELAQTIAANPFLKQRGINIEKLHVTFLSGPPEAPAIKKLAGYTIAPDQSCCVGSSIYLYLPNGFSTSSLFRVSWEKALAVVTTTRNWRTVNTLHQMCQECK